MGEAHEEALRLAEERAERRRAGDFASADALRDRIRDLGFVVIDTAEGWVVEPLPPPAAPVRVRLEDVESVLEHPADRDVTVHWLAEGWPDDVVRGIVSLRRWEGTRRVQHIVVEAVEAPVGIWPEGVEVVRLDRDPGFGAARNAGLARTGGRLVLVADGSIEAVGDVLGPIEEIFADPSVGIAGPFGLVTPDLHEFHESESRDVDAVEGYLMAFRRDILERGLRFDRGFRFYRNADIDLSFQIRSLGLRAVRVDVPVRRHEHRRWEHTPPQERWRLSRRNFYRFLDRFRGRTDLLVGGS